MIAAGAGLSTAADPEAAAEEAAAAAARRLGGARPSLAAAFASPHHAEGADRLLARVHDVAAPEAVIGCIGEAVLGGRREVERAPALSVWMAAFPGPAATFHLEVLRTAERSVVAGWPPGGEGRVHLLVCDPYTFPADPWLRALEAEEPGAVVIGGMASGGEPGGTRLFVDRAVVTEGAVGVRLPAGVAVRPLVSQGCRPIGESYTVTRAEDNILHELGGRPPLERIRELYASASPHERALMASGLHIGRAIDEYKPELGRGDFLIRGVVGADESSGAIAVGDAIEVGETVRFHIRDADSAGEDLRHLLAGAAAGASAALLFTCNGRGSRLFPVPDHDATAVSDALGDPPLAGFFCAGELGPVGGRNFVHGFTASLAIFDVDPAGRPAG
ncbi:MAG TPA: FIST N-terminal domain-containing protein [Actinomycetota bacterium]|nr:FIST N-terminal domain-containing protein [Actinomycetota bacterium]